MISKKRLILFGSIILFFSSIMIYRAIETYHEERLLKTSETTKAILKRIEINTTPKSGYSGGVFEYDLNGHNIEFSDKGNFRMLRIGDTVLIKYSIEDPSVARVIDKYYMEKYKSKKQRK